LNEAGVRFRLKAINDPQQFVRCDAAVLYVRKEDYPVVEPVLGQIYTEVARHMHREVPALTRAVAPGLGLAEDPGDGDSFGMHRCRLVAEGIIRAYEQGLGGLQDRMQCVADVFAEEGISLEVPYLAPGSDEYRVESRGWQEADTTHIGHPRYSDLGPSYSPLEMAHKLGRQIVGEAVWYEGRCNWVGAEVQGDDKGSGLVRTIYSALGPDFYAGTAGIAFFLGELYRATGDDGLRATALGAVRQALSRVENIPAEGGMGLYTGGMGIALATVRLGIVLGDEELVEAGRTVAGAAMQTAVGANHDLLAGSAGAIVGCLLLARMVGDASFLREDALRIGGAVVEAAHKRRGCYSWGEGGRGAGRDLTGFSHGTAGIGHALLELWAAGGAEEYKWAAEAAFEYERKWFDSEQANWPDFRETGRGLRAQKGAYAFATAWCHGAPGIALSRLRAYDLLGGEAYREEAVVALRTTRRAVESELVSGLGNYSLCHGLGGNASVLLHAQKPVGEEMAGTEQLACAVGEAGAARYGNSGAAWPCGVGNEQTPSLMLGLAGIGHFYLRLSDPSVPCVLLLDKEEWGRA
jgi:lantibiotic modifying enzyme